MDDKSISMILRELSNDYYHNLIGFEEYREQRKVILDTIDLQINGKKKVPEEEPEDAQSSLFMQTITFLQDQDVD